MRLIDRIRQGKIEGKTGRDIFNALEKAGGLDKPVIVSVLHHCNDEEMPAMFDIADVVPVDDHVLISCANVLVPGTVDELTKDIEYKTMVNFGTGGRIDNKTIKE